MRKSLIGAAAAALSLAVAAGAAGCDRAARAAARGEVGCAGCTVIAGGTVFDGARAGRGVVVIDGDRIADVVFGDPVIRAGEVIDAHGQTVLPGLIDLHVHLMADAYPLGAGGAGGDHLDDHLKAMLRAGVTSYLDLGSSAHVIFTYRERIARGALLGPRLFAAGPLLTPTGGHPCYAGSPPGDFCLFVDSPADVGGVFAKLAPQKPDVVKIVIESGATKPVPRMSAASIAAVEGAAEADDLRVIAHVSAAKDIEDALDSGVRLFAHTIIEEAISPALAAKMAARGAVVVPTLAVMDAFDRIARGALTEVNNPALGDDVPADVIASLRDPAALARMTTPAYRALTATWRANAMSSLKALHAAGVTLAAGTDAGNPGTFHGPAMARELALYVEAGLTPEEALRAATSTAADLLQRPDLGRLAKGAAADVLVVEGDALADIRAVGRVKQVYRGGALLDRAALALPRKTSLVKQATLGVPAGGTCLEGGECAAKLGCDFDATCVPVCDAQGGCATGSACLSTPGAAAAGLCYPGEGCDPVTQDCVNGAACVLLGNGATVCWPAGSGKGGAACDASGACSAGSGCSYGTGTCVDYCDPAGVAGAKCPPGKACVDASSWTGVDVGFCQ